MSVCANVFYYVLVTTLLCANVFYYVLVTTLCSQERESQKLHWLQKSVQELSNEKWVIPALKQMKEICLLYLEVSCILFCLHK